MSQENLVRIQRMSCLFRWLFTILLLAITLFSPLPSGSILMISRKDFVKTSFLSPEEQISTLQMVFATLANMVPVGAGYVHYLDISSFVFFLRTGKDFHPAKCRLLP